MILKATSYRTMEIKSRSGRIGAQFFHVSSLFECLPTSVISDSFTEANYLDTMSVT